MRGLTAKNFEYKTPEIRNVIDVQFTDETSPRACGTIILMVLTYKKETKLLKRLQRRVTKVIPALRTKRYEKKLTLVKLSSLNKILRGGVTHVFQKINKFDNVTHLKFLELRANASTICNGVAIKSKTL